MEKILLNISKRGGLSRFLQIFSHAVSALSVLAFGYLSILTLRESAIAFLELCIILGVPFLAVTVIRKAINAPRPYEIYDFYEDPPKNKRGCSFPSRHAYSAFAIGTFLCFESPLLGGILLLFALGMCTARVLLGIHFIRDVLTGALVGAVSTLLGKLIFWVI
jgi:membrane-associated phospholipid phosphatase